MIAPIIINYPFIINHIYENIFVPVFLLHFQADNGSEKSVQGKTQEEIFLPNLLTPGGVFPRGFIGAPPMLGSGLTNPAFISQLQQIQRLHAQNSRLIGMLSRHYSLSFMDFYRVLFPKGDIFKNFHRKFDKNFRWPNNEYDIKRRKIWSTPAAFSCCRYPLLKIIDFYIFFIFSN